MGWFHCTNCQRRYYQQRFLWEPSDPRESEALPDAGKASPDGGCEGVQEEWKPLEETGELVEMSDEELLRFYTSLPEYSSPACGLPSQGEDSNFELSTSCGTSQAEADGNEAEAGEDINSELSTSCTTSQAEADGIEAEALPVFTAALDSSNAVGNLTSPLSLAPCLLPVTVVASLGGVAAGCLMVSDGVATASGHVDQYLVVRGSCTATLATAGAVLGVAAITAATPMTLIYIGLVVSGMDLASAAVLDFALDGLCPSCRKGKVCKEEKEDAEVWQEDEEEEVYGDEGMPEGQTGGQTTAILRQSKSMVNC